MAASVRLGSRPRRLFVLMRICVAVEFALVTATAVRLVLNVIGGIESTGDAKVDEGRRQLLVFTYAIQLTLVLAVAFVLCLVFVGDLINRSPLFLPYIILNCLLVLIMMGLFAWAPVRWFGQRLGLMGSPSPLPWTRMVVLFILSAVQIVPIVIVVKCYRHVRRATAVLRQTPPCSNIDQVLDKQLL